MRPSATLALVLLILPGALSTPAAGGKPRLPIMGWSSWNAFYCNVHESDVRNNADLLVSMGLADLGYRQVNVDDCWNEASRDAAGKLVASSSSFPSGIPALSKYLHNKSLKLGLYTSQTSQTCAGRAGAFGHEASDAAQYCGWEIDYLKIDLCGGKQHPVLNTSWQAFREGFSTCGRPVELSVEYCGPDHPGGPPGTDPAGPSGCGAWIADVADLWRTSSDLQPEWGSAMAAAAANDAMADVARPGKSNDPDMLQVGNFLFAQGNMNKVEMKSHYALWAIMAAPLILGHDLSDFGPGGQSNSMSAEEFMAVVGNKDVIAIDQDARAVQGRNVTSKGTTSSVVGAEVWAKPLADGAVAVLLLNNGVSSSLKITASWAQIGLKLPGSDASNDEAAEAQAEVVDVWTGKSLGTHFGSFSATVALHDHRLLKVSPPPVSRTRRTGARTRLVQMPMRPSHAVNVTLYHVGGANFTSLANVNSGDAAGDADFMLRAAGLPFLCSNKSGEAEYTYDCDDAEQTGDDLVVTKVVVEADSRWSEYAECNVANGTYTCECRNQSAPYSHHHHALVPCNNTVGRIPVVEESGWAHEKPNASDPDAFMRSSYRFYFYNAAQKFQGIWFSTLSQGQCGHAGANCTWRVVEQVKRVKKTCQEAWVFKTVEAAGKTCFARCPPGDRTTACWTACFYDTVFGPASNRTAYPHQEHLHLGSSGAGMDAQVIVDAWTAAFESEDPEKGGCPGV